MPSRPRSERGGAKPRRRKTRKAALPGHSAPAPSLAEAHAAELARVKARAAAGERLANHESRLLRDAWLADMAVHIWPNLEAASADLGVSPGTVRNWAQEGCPGIEAHSPVPKAPVLSWLLKRAHERGGQAPATRESIEEVELRLKRSKADAAEKRLVAEGQDTARAAAIHFASQLRHHLVEQLPGTIAEACRAAGDDSAATDAARDRIEQALATFAAGTVAGATPGEPA